MNKSISGWLRWIGGCVLAAAAVAAAQPPTTQPAMKSAGRHFHYGVNLHMLWQPPFERYLDALDQLGVDTVRDNLAWETVQPAPGVWNFTDCDRIVDACRSKGIGFQALLGYGTKWASTGDTTSKNFNDWNKAAPRLEAFVDYAARMTEHFKGRVTDWEIWNEPDIEFWLGSTQQYVATFNATAAAITKASPSARVMNGGLTFLHRKPNPDFDADFLPAADRQHWAVWAYHDYPNFSGFLTNANRSRELMSQYKLHLPVWVNEGGFHTLNAGGELEQASTLVKKMAAAPQFGIEAYVWYELVDGGVDPKEPEHHFGLLRADLTPKPAYYAYQHLIRTLAPRQFIKRLEVGNDVWALQYAGDTKSVIVIWTEQVSGTITLTAPPKTSGFAAFDLWGRYVPIEQTNDGPQLAVSNQPIYLHYSGAAPTLALRSVVPVPLPKP